MAMRIDILTLFPEFFDAFRNTSIPGRAVRNGFVDISTTSIRDFAIDRYGSVDDAPFGGGPGMVLRCEPVFAAVEHVRKNCPEPAGKVILMTPQGRPLKQNIVRELAAEPRLILIAGHYEGFDERIRTTLADDEISLGDFVLSGGEIAAMALADAVIRLLPGALGKDASSEEESFSGGLLEYPHYTRPREFMGQAVPDVLLSGDHARIEQWRLEQSQLRTRIKRPDLWEQYLRQTQDKN
ncbi:MAG TPA: tRNA (guanosine(37)-N1)-methyltransferase TrmD [Phycisphaerae bacterium]|nr:tRNA (guanosine(37)-N1)-methyltransferase TrmD [Phycisphaerae bacterium]HPS52962.1 tRNA (guanosine(37)-N1)-methyltransferase TrmD [Phycisphaerae bacterium]